MAGDWIKMRSNLWDDPRVSRICDLTDQIEAPVVGALYWLWAMADQHTEDGILPGLTLRQIDRKTGIPGVGDALVEVGWLADHPEGVRITRFEEHNGSSAKKRIQTAKRVAIHKAGNAEVTHGALAKTPDSVSSALPREEERREEIPPTNVGGDAPRKRSAAPELVCPPDVDQQTWADWQALRKAKKAPITETVLTGARSESVAAGMTLDAFLQVWCMRGSQGMQADWLKPHERQTQSRVSFADHDEQTRRRKWEDMTGRKWPESGDVFDVTPITQRIEA